LQSNEEAKTMSETSTLIGYQGGTISRLELALIQTPAGISTHVPVPHYEIVQALVETLGFRHIRVTADEYAVSLLLAAIYRVRSENALEPIRCVHIGFQRSRTHPPVARYSQTGELSR
jgi:hypothetical protein